MDHIIDHVIMLVTGVHPVQTDFVASQSLRDGGFSPCRSILLQSVHGDIGGGPNICDVASEDSEYDIKPGLAYLLRQEHQYMRNYGILLPDHHQKPWCHSDWDGVRLQAAIARNSGVLRLASCPRPSTSILNIVH